MRWLLLQIVGALGIGSLLNGVANLSGIPDFAGLRSIAVAAAAVAIWIPLHRWLTHTGRPGPDRRTHIGDPDLNTRIMHLSAAYNLVQRQIEGQYELNRKRLAAIHRLQAEVRALVFEREAREAGATDAES